MTTETYLDLTYDRGKGSKRPLRPKLLKLTDVTIPHRSRKKNKVKAKDRSATTVRERIYDDPAYTEDISHLANPMRRSSISGKPLSEHKGSRSDSVGQLASAKHQLAKELHQYVTGKQGKHKGQPQGHSLAGAPGATYDCDSSSSDNEPPEPIKGTSSMTRRVRSLERSLAISAAERGDKKAVQKRSSKQKRNLSLDNSRHLPPGHSQREREAGNKHQSQDFEGRPRKERNRKQYSEAAATTPEAGQAELDDVYSIRSSAQESADLAASEAKKVAIGKRFLRGEIGIKSFNYYLLKEGLKSTKKQRNPSEAAPKAEKLHARSEENIYEEIFFKDTPPKDTLPTSSATMQQCEKEAQSHHRHHSQKEKHSEGASGEAYADCELCMEQCSKENCEFCLPQGSASVAGGKVMMAQQQQQLDSYINQRLQAPDGSENRTPSSGIPAAHILEFQSYNPNNPGVYKIETTPVAITGDYNPILQFQQSSANTSTSATSTPSEHQHQHQQQQLQQLQQQIYGGYYLPHPNQRPYQTVSPLVGNPMASHYAAGGSLLLAHVAGAATPPRRAQQQHYIVGFQNGGGGAGGGAGGAGSTTGATSLQRLNTKSSSSSDSLPYHKYNTMARLEANVFASPTTGDLYYAVGNGSTPLHPLMYAASRPIGGSQILVDPYDPPQMYKSDSKASILSEFSLRSSDNSQRYARHPHRRHGGRVSDSSLFSVYSNSGQRRYFGSSDSRFGYDCRRCSLDGVIGMGSASAGHMAAPDKCSYSDNCRYECRNCDCSSNYFSSDFDDVYGSIVRGGSSGIPRKTAAGTLPSSGQEEPKENTPPPPPPSSIEQHQYQQAPVLDLKQNKYAQDFFKHVNDVKRSIYQSEMQRNNSLESSRRGPRSGSNASHNPRSSPKRTASQEPSQEPVVTTLPLSRGRPAAGVKPTPAPRTSLQPLMASPAITSAQNPTPSKRKSQPSGRREYPSLDRLVASSTGTIPKRHNRTVAEMETSSLSPKLISKSSENSTTQKLNVSVEEHLPTPKRHHRTSGSKSHQNVGGPSLRRKDIPAPPPPSPATYSDLQELKANMEGLQDDTKSRSLESEPAETTADQKGKLQSASIQLQAAPKKMDPPKLDPPNLTAAEMEDSDVFYDARSEDSNGGIVPSTEDSAPAKKGTSSSATSSELAPVDSAINGNHKAAIESEMAHSTKDVRPQSRSQSPTLSQPASTSPSPRHCDPTGAEEEQEREQASGIAGRPEGNAIVIGSDEAKEDDGQQPPEQSVESKLVEPIRTVPPLVLVPPQLPTGKGAGTETETGTGTGTVSVTEEMFVKGTEEDEKLSKTKHDNERVAATCSEGQRSSSPATNVARVISPITNNKLTNSNNSNSVAEFEFEFSCKTGNTDSASPAVSYSDQATDVPAQPRPVTRQDYACLDSSEAQSDDSHLTRDSITRESQNDELSSSTLEKLDVSTLPLPALPKRRRTRSRTSPSKHLQQLQKQHPQPQPQPRHEAGEEASASEQPFKPRQRTVTPSEQPLQRPEISAPKSNSSSQNPTLLSQNPQNPQQQQQPHLSAFQQYVAKRRESLEASNRSFNEKLEARRMHYHLGGNGSGANGANGVPTYLFGEHCHVGPRPGSGRKSISPATNKEEIFLNKSGWVQVNTKRGSSKDDNYHRLHYGHQNGGTSHPTDIGRGRTYTRAMPVDHGRRSDLARQSFILQHQQLQQKHQQQQSNASGSEPKFVGSKVEELIQRNEARLSGFSSRDPALRPGYRIIDPQLANILNERPGFLPVKSPNDLDSPITPILSPPPAFQDNSTRSSSRHPDRRKPPIRQQAPLPLPLPLPVPLQSQTQLGSQHMASNASSGKGMVFSRSFEYDTRRPTPTDSYVETFSRSFDGNLSEQRPLNLAMPGLAGLKVGQRERSPNFSTLTGNSPNYLTKREGGGGSSGSLRSRDSSPKYLNPQTTTAYLNAAVKEAPPVYSLASGANQAKYSPRSRHERNAERSKSHALGRSRKSQFSRVGSAGPLTTHPQHGINVAVSRFRSFDTSKSQRLNSCDSGARSDLSNDELDNEEGGLSEFLSAGTHKFPKAGTGTGTSCVSISPFKMQRQRSLTPDRNESHSSSNSLRKQRSLTPESRSLTPEERRKKGSQLSLIGSRQNSGSRSSTLESRQRHEDKTPLTISRSSSSSSYSGGDSHELLNASTSSTVTASVAVPAGNSSSSHRRALAAKQAEQEHRIRRSRSLQLTERSPNRTHKSIVNVGAVVAQQQQSQQPSYQQSRFPPTIRASQAGSKISHGNAPVTSGNSVRVRQNEADKARSFDFDYNNYNRGGGGTKVTARSTHTSGSGGDSGSNQNLRVERESRSFDEDYREAGLNNNNGGGGSGSGSVSGLRFLQPTVDSGHGSVASSSQASSRLRKSNSPVNTASVEHGASRSPQSSGSSSNNLHQSSRQTGSPQSYGTRLCDHELTYDMLRKSPIMNFRRGDSSDYELPVMLRNRETINSGGNSELNFMSNETRIYEHPTTVLKPQRSLRQSPGSRDDLTLEVAVGVGGDYIYRQAQAQATQPRSSSSTTTDIPTTATTKSCSKTLDTCDYWPRCAACQEQSAPGGVKREPVSASTRNKEPAAQPHVTTVAVAGDTLKVEKMPRVEKSPNPPWTLLCTWHPPEQVGSGKKRSPEAVAAENEIALRSTQDRQDYDSQQKTRRRKRCRSLPSRMPPGPLPVLVRMPKSGNHGVRTNNGFAVGLSQQMRAVSSPTLTEPLTEAVPVAQQKPDGSSVANISTSANGGGGLGVLQKFKRTLNNFNSKNQLHISSLPTTVSANSQPKPKTSPTMPTVSITAPATTTAGGESLAEGGDASSGKYRFGPLIWRTSKERRKTKFNRRDKCNSGDSGIQIELEQDEQYSRVLAINGQAEKAAPTPAANRISNESNARTIRRTNSAKASSLLGPFALKSKNAKHFTDRAEREAPESLPTRSLSQPNGLETYGMGRQEMDDSDSDSVASHEEGVSYYTTIYAEVLYNFTAGGSQELGLERGMLIEILRKEVGPWWFGRIKKEETNLVEEILDPELGWFPKEFVRIIHCPETDVFFNAHRAQAEADAEAQAEEAAASGGELPVAVLTFSDDADVTVSTDHSNITTIVIESPPAPLTEPNDNVQLDHNTILRRSAIRELLETEVNYVKLLASICDGYLPAMSKRIDIFSPNSIRLIFSNITAIYKFQRKFLEALRRGIEQNQIAKVFLKMHKGFLCYSTYCNAYPRALIELETYDRVKDARTILENCRESENLAELPLSAHLLAPVQRICRYPLHLNEVIKSAVDSAAKNGEDEVDEGIKATPPDYEQLDISELDLPDSHDIVSQALEAMRGITEAVNEGKRHSETIARHQASFQNFKGPPLHLHSARFFLQVDATRQKQNLWNSSYTLFLFDNQLVYCKRDIIKRSHFIYKGRIFLDRCRFVNMRDGKMFGHTIKNSLRIYCESRDKWYDFSFRSANRKQRFLSTLALERQFGGKALYLSEMTGFEYNYEERPGDFSDQSDYEVQDFEHAASGESSVPDSPAKSTSRLCETLPKKSQSRDGISSADNSQLSTASTGSLGRRRIGNWFRKPKSANCTPSQSPTHKPGFDADATLTEARVAAMELAEAAAALVPTDSSSA